MRSRPILSLNNRNIVSSINIFQLEITLFFFSIFDPLTAWFIYKLCISLKKDYIFCIPGVLFNYLQSTDIHISMIYFQTTLVDFILCFYIFPVKRIKVFPWSTGHLHDVIPSWHHPIMTSTFVTDWQSFRVLLFYFFEILFFCCNIFSISQDI